MCQYFILRNKTFQSAELEEEGHSIRRLTADVETFKCTIPMQEHDAWMRSLYNFIRKVEKWGEGGNTMTTHTHKQRNFINPVYVSKQSARHYNALFFFIAISSGFISIFGVDT
jgi:hypothetical protein